MNKEDVYKNYESCFKYFDNFKAKSYREIPNYPSQDKFYNLNGYVYNIVIKKSNRYYTVQAYRLCNTNKTFGRLGLLQSDGSVRTLSIRMIDSNLRKRFSLTFSRLLERVVCKISKDCTDIFLCWDNSDLECLGFNILSKDLTLAGYPRVIDSVKLLKETDESLNNNLTGFRQVVLRSCIWSGEIGYTKTRFTKYIKSIRDSVINITYDILTDIGLSDLFICENNTPFELGFINCDSKKFTINWGSICLLSDNFFDNCEFHFPLNIRVCSITYDYNNDTWDFSGRMPIALRSRLVEHMEL